MLANVYGLRVLGQPRMRLAVLVVVLIVAIGVRIGTLLLYLPEEQWGYDFSAYWEAGRRLLHGGDLYSQAQLAGPYAFGKQFSYVYPPLLAVLMRPFALLPTDAYRQVVWLWDAMDVAILVASVVALGRTERAELERRVAILRGRGRWLLVAAAFAFPAIVAEIVYGNVHIVLLGLLTLAWLGLRRNDAKGNAIAGSAIAVAALVKVFPAILVVWLIGTRRWNVIAWTAVAGAVLVATTLPVVGVQAWLDYPLVLLHYAPPADASLALAPTSWLTPVIGFAAARVVVLVAGVAVIAVTSIRRSEPIGFAVATMVSVLMTTWFFQPYLSIFVLPMVLGLAWGAPIRLLVLGYFCMWTGGQPLLGPYAWVLIRLIPSIGISLVLASLLVVRPVSQPATVSPST